MSLLSLCQSTSNPAFFEWFFINMMLFTLNSMWKWINGITSKYKELLITNTSPNSHIAALPAQWPIFLSTLMSTHLRYSYYCICHCDLVYFSPLGNWSLLLRQRGLLNIAKPTPNAHIHTHGHTHTRWIFCSIRPAAAHFITRHQRAADVWQQ